MDCSPLRPTPETDAALAAGMDAAQTHAMLQRLERQRDDFRNMLADAVTRGDAYMEAMDAARREAEIERDKHCHPDHGGHKFSWENDQSAGTDASEETL